MLWNLRGCGLDRQDAGRGFPLVLHKNQHLLAGAGFHQAEIAHPSVRARAPAAKRQPVEAGDTHRRPWTHPKGGKPAGRISSGLRGGRFEISPATRSIARSVHHIADHCRKGGFR